MGPNFTPFRSKGHCFRDKSENWKIQDGRRRPSWMWSPHQTCFRDHRSYALLVQISLCFALKATVTEIKSENWKIQDGRRRPQRPSWMWSPHQTCFRCHRSYALRVQISLRFALKATVTEIRAKIEKFQDGRRRPSWMWSPHQTCFRCHRSYALRVQISLRFALKATVTEIRAKMKNSKMAAGGHLECGLHTKHVLRVIVLWRAGPNFTPFRSTGSHYRDTLKKVKNWPIFVFRATILGPSSDSRQSSSIANLSYPN